MERDVIENFSKEDAAHRADQALLKAAREEAAPTLQRLHADRERLEKQLDELKARAVQEREAGIDVSSGGLIAQGGKLVVVSGEAGGGSGGPDTPSAVRWIIRPPPLPHADTHRLF